MQSTSVTNPTLQLHSELNKLGFIIVLSCLIQANYLAFRTKYVDL